MTYRDKLTIEHPNAVGREFRGGCLGCPNHYDYGPEVMHGSDCIYDCKKCWDRIIPPSSSSIVTTIKPQIDISALINEAMKKKDRQVYILCYDGKITIDVKPFTESKPHWIYREGKGRYEFECSECGFYNEFESPFCPECGEKLAKSEVRV